MREPVRVMVLGTGQMGSGIARLVLDKPELELVGVYAKRAERHGMDVGRAIGLECDLGVPVNGDLVELLESARPAVAIQATCSLLTDAREEIMTLLQHGVRIISIAEEMAYPAARSVPVAAEIERLARDNDAAVVGTGINPGFVMDLLIIVLTGVCMDVQSIMAERVNDLSPYGATVLASQGVGLAAQEFRERVASGQVSGHHGFSQSIHMIAQALGWNIDRIEQSREPIVSKVRRETPLITVLPGQTAGCLHCATGYRDGVPAITLRHPQQIHPHLEDVQTGDSIEISGTPNIHLAGTPEIAGGKGTIALAVNMIPRVMDAAPGLYCMADLPIPAALASDPQRDACAHV
ncbi:MAG: 2,4-diaminopentanoate dehydrogenase [Gammaproteobacteria bacterium]|nr:2,4-diaminopentanoate dehydrogenase [Gammaproteobacteria bacterium]